MKDKSGTKKLTGRLVWRVVLAVCVVALIVGVIHRVTKPKDEVVTTPLPTVSVKPAEVSDITVETSLIGTVDEGDVYYVTPKVSGEIREIYISQGDSVSEGDPIAKIDNQKQIDAAKIALDSARVQQQLASDSLVTAENNLNRMQALFATGDVSAQSYEQTKNAYDQADSALKSAKLQLENAQLQYDTQVEYATVVSPVSGIVEAENMDLNALASQSTQLCVIRGEGAKKVKFAVIDRLLGALHLGDAIRVEKQGSTYEGSVTSIETMPDAQSGLYPIEASVADGGALTNGASVKVYFVSEQAEGVLAVDADSVYYDGGKVYVYTVTYNDETAATASDAKQPAKAGEADKAVADSRPAEGQAAEKAAGENQAADAEPAGQQAAGAEAAGGTSTISPNNRAATVHKIEVETGITDNKKTEIKSGISTDDQVVKTWTAQLYEGAQVQVLPAAASAGNEED